MHCLLCHIYCVQLASLCVKDVGTFPAIPYRELCYRCRSANLSKICGSLSQKHRNRLAEDTRAAFVRKSCVWNTGIYYKELIGPSYVVYIVLNVTNFQICSIFLWTKTVEWCNQMTLISPLWTGAGSNPVKDTECLSCRSFFMFCVHHKTFCILFGSIFSEDGVFDAIISLISQEIFKAA